MRVDVEVGRLNVAERDAKDALQLEAIEATSKCDLVVLCSEIYGARARRHVDVYREFQRGRISERRARWLKRQLDRRLDQKFAKVKGCSVDETANLQMIALALQSQIDAIRSR